MEYPFSPKQKGIGYWASPRLQIDGVAPSDVGMRNPISEDSLNNCSELMNFDTYAGWYNSPSATDHMFASYGLSSFQSMPCASSLDALNFAQQNSVTDPAWGNMVNTVGTSDNCGDKLVFQRINSQFCHPSDSSDADDLGVRQGDGAHQQSNMSNTINCTISRPIGMSLDEKMLKALSFLKESSKGGILAQVWVPIRHGNQYLLTTSEQPYLLDHMLAGYREVSRTFTFSAEVRHGLPLGLPGRVFTSKVPEWTSNVIYYSKAEYLRVKHAIDHEVRGSIAVPVFDPSEMSCRAVLELVTVKEKPDFDSEMENVCNALQAVNLRSIAPPRLLPQCLSRNQRAALAEITDVLRAVCHAHRLPLALTWIPCNYTEEAIDEIVKVRVREGNSESSGKCVLCIEDTACYVNDKEMQGFVHACVEHFIEEGQGIAGKALQSNHPFFIPDVKTYDVAEYPLVHHARKHNLNAAVAIRLQSTYTGDDDYVLEFFLPINIKGSAEQQLLLNNLSGTMQRLCKSLRTVSDAEITEGGCPKVGLPGEIVSSFPPMSMSRRNTQPAFSEGNLDSIDKTPFNVCSSKSDLMESDGPHEKAIVGSKKQPERKKNAAEKNVSLSVLQQYFSGSLKDAAKSIGVCPTTLKRICRQHGISRWPSRKINKVNRSLRKVQTVLDSVHGVEGGLKFDPATGGFVAASCISQEVDLQKGFLFPEGNLPAQNSEPITQGAVCLSQVGCISADNSALKVKGDECFLVSHQGASRKSSAPVINCSENSELFSKGSGLRQQASLGESWACLENPFSDPCFARGGKRWFVDTDNVKLESSDSHFASRSSSSMAIADEMDTKIEGDDGTVEHNQPTCSSITDSSNGSGSMMHGSISSSPSFEEGKHLKVKTCGDSGSKITVKATYKEDTNRFKFEPSSGSYQLYEEVSKRFKLQIGTFQLKYLDDEEEWVMLVSDSDLQECLEIMDYVGTRSVKFLVRDKPFTAGSSGGSNCFLAGNS